MKKQNISNKLQLKKALVADLEIRTVLGGKAQDTLNYSCVSYPNRCTIVECQHTDVTCIYTDTCQRPSN
ncbi:MAG: hypothetical protein AAF617_05900 [Bacteroidota bacterium]